MDDIDPTFNPARNPRPGRGASDGGTPPHSTAASNLSNCL